MLTKNLNEHQNYNVENAEGVKWTIFEGVVTNANILKNYLNYCNANDTIQSISVREFFLFSFYLEFLP